MQTSIWLLTKHFLPLTILMTVWELLEFLQTRKTTDIVYVGNNDWKEISVSAPADYFTALSDNEVTIVWNINSFYDGE